MNGTYSIHALKKSLMEKNTPNLKKIDNAIILTLSTHTHFSFFFYFDISYHLFEVSRKSCQIKILTLESI